VDESVVGAVIVVNSVVVVTIGAIAIDKVLVVGE